MFTGIVEALCPLQGVTDAQGLRRLSVEVSSHIANSVTDGDSVSVNGVCLTLAVKSANLLEFDVVRETLERSNLSRLGPGDLVNVERSLRYGDPIGGHLLSGHIWSCIRCTGVEREGENFFAWFALKPDYRPYVLPKGFVALDGVSLTVASVEPDHGQFGVSLIPETRRRTRFSHLDCQDLVNLELDSQTQAIVDTVERVLEARDAPGNRQGFASNN